MSLEKKTRLEVEADQRRCIEAFTQWSDEDQVEFLCSLLSRMSHDQHSQINSLLEPLLQRDFIMALPARGLPHISANILSYLDADSLYSVELVSQGWQWIVVSFQLWRRLIVRRMATDSVWRGLGERRGWFNVVHLADPAIFCVLLQQMRATALASAKRGVECPNRDKVIPFGDNWSSALPAPITQEAIHAAASLSLPLTSNEAMMLAHRFYKQLYPRINHDIQVSRFIE